MSGEVGDFLEKRERKWGHVGSALDNFNKDLGSSMLILSASVGLLLSEQELELMQCANIEANIEVVRGEKRLFLFLFQQACLFIS